MPPVECLSATGPVEAIEVQPIAGFEHRVGEGGQLVAVRPRQTTAMSSADIW